MPSTQLSPRAAVLMGVIFVAAGIVPILGALGVLPLPLTPGTPVWVGVSAGLLFVLAGGAAPDGDLPPGTTFGVRLTQSILGLGIYGLFAAIFGWVAFGKGERHFSTTINLPFMTQHGFGSEWMGRAVFGVGAIAVGAFGVAIAIRSLKKWRR